MQNTTSTDPARILLQESVVADLVLQAVRDTTTLRGHPSLVDISTLTPYPIPRGMPTDGVVVVPIRDGIDAWSSTAETTAAAADTAVGMTTVSVSVADHDLCRGVTDQLRLRDQTGTWDLDSLAVEMVIGADKTFTSAVAALASSISTTVGQADQALTWSVIKEAQGSLHIRGMSFAVGLVCILHPEQWVAVQADIAAAGGQIQFRADMVSTQAARPTGYVGSYDGIDFYSLSAIPEGEEAGYVGMMIAAGAIGYLEIPQPMATPATVRVLDADVITVEEVRDGTNKRSRLIGAYTFGTQILRQELCVGILGAGSGA